jgi:two-component system, NtrC family, nitrogen regulation sensor histidine kinase NtrY
MSAPNPSRPDHKLASRKKVIIPLAVGLALLFWVLLSLTSFDLPLNPNTNQQLLFFASLSALIFLLFVALTFVLARNLLKLFAERRLGVLGSKFRTRLVVGSLLLSFLPVIGMFFFAYVLMNRSIDKWFSTPVEEVRRDTATMASLLSNYAAQNTRAEAEAIASLPETQSAFASHSFSALTEELQRHASTLQGGFAVAMVDGEAQASFGAPASWPQLKAKLPQLRLDTPISFTWEQTDYIVGTAPVRDHGVGDLGVILVGIPLPKQFSETVKQVEASQQRYLDLARERRLVRRT